MIWLLDPNFMTLLFLIILSSLVGGVLSLIGGIILLYKASWAKAISVHFLSFAAGVMLSVAFLDLLPESLEIFQETDKGVANIFSYIFYGFISFFLLEGLIHIVFAHKHGSDCVSQDTKECDQATPWLVNIGDSFHNFLDGVAIGASFLISIPLGVSTALAIMAHEIPQEIGDFSIMLHAGWRKKNIIIANLASALFSTAGAALAFFFRGFLNTIQGELLAFIGGFFLYIAAVNIIPEIYRLPKKERLYHVVPILFIGIAVIILIKKIIPE